MTPRTSATHPLHIATLGTPGGGRIGMTFCPGKHDPWAMTGAWARDLDADLASIRAWGAGALVTLVEGHELVDLGVPDLGERARGLGLAWYHLPIPDVSVPGPAFSQPWAEARPQLCDRLRIGGGVLVHCRGGLGRTGLVAALLLIELGEVPRQALARVRAARPGAVETAAQEAWVLDYRPAA